MPDPKLAACLADLRAEVDHYFPKRDDRSDGWIADTNHASTSDHQPNRAGVVRAIDIDDDLGAPTAPAEVRDAKALAERIRRLIVNRDSRLTPGGYVIYNGRIASERFGGVWREYEGRNPHTSHIHVSCTTNPQGWTRQGVWIPEHKIVTAPKPYPRPNRRVLSVGSRGDDVALVQRFLGIEPATGYFGALTAREVRDYQRMRGLPVDGIVGPRTWAPILAALR